MAIDPETPPAEPDQRGSNTIYAYATWLVIGLCCYAGPFGLLCVDHFVLNDQLFEESLSKLSPDVQDRLEETLQFVYWPVLHVMRLLKIIPS